MGEKKVLLMHITDISGHQAASLAIEKALYQLDSQVQVQKIDALNCTNSSLGKSIYGLYLFLIKSIPSLWGYLYDNKVIMDRLKRFRLLIHKLSNSKMHNLYDRFHPDIVVCTQAFPCGLVADYKRRYNSRLPLIGVLTDYAPHGYWLNELVDKYILPASTTEGPLLRGGVPKDKLKVFGIPINPKFQRKNDREKCFSELGLDPKIPVILVMGGGQGLGPIKKIVQTLDKINASAQLIVICGANQKLYRYLNRNKVHFNKLASVIGHTSMVDKFMDMASFIVTKPGGLTSAEALSKSVPILIIRPLPGQEMRNAEFLLKIKAAIKVDSFKELKATAEDLLHNTNKLDELRKNAASFAYPCASLNIAKLILDTIEQEKSIN